MMEHDAAPRGGARPRRILLVDDEVLLTRLFRLNLEEEGGYEVRSENSARAGLAAVPEFDPDLILLDVAMPGMTGREMATVLGADPDFGRTPILFLTAVPPDEPRESRDGELDGHPRLMKPFSTAHVVALIEVILAGTSNVPRDVV